MVIQRGGYLADGRELAAGPADGVLGVIGARDERQLRDNLGAVGWRLDPEQIARLDAVSTRDAPYPYFPYFRQEVFARLNPPVATG